MNVAILWQALTALAVMAGAAWPFSTESAWPSIVIDQLPEGALRIVESAAPLRIGEDGYLRYFRTAGLSWEESPLVIEGPPDWETADLNGSVPWIVVLQAGNGRSEDDIYRLSHFAVNATDVFQTREPGISGSPEVVWQLPPVDWDAYTQNGQPYVYSAFTVSRDPRFQGLGTSLADLYETRISLHRRAIIVRVDEQTQEESLENLVGVLWALRRYEINAWQIFDNREIYGNNRDPRRDLGPATAARLRYYLGLVALVRGSEADKQLYFGPFLGEDGDRQTAVENYFASIREYLMRVITPAEIQEWDAQTGYFLFRDLLTGEHLPIANSFADPVPENLQTAGGYRHLMHERDEETDEELDRYHIGEDFNVGSGNDDLGFPVSAIAVGRVVYTGYVYNGLGNIIIVRHRLPDGSEVYSRYAHLNEILVAGGQTVRLGETIGTIGRTGRGNDPDFYAHLHAELTYAETYERYMVTTPGYYPNDSREVVERYFLDLLDFISLSQETLQAREVR